MTGDQQITLAVLAAVIGALVWDKVRADVVALVGAAVLLISGAVRPIDRGTAADLVFLKTDTGAAATHRATFSTATATQSPLAAVLGIRHAF